MSEKFTPGPWHVNYSKFSQVEAANGAIVATCNRLSNLVNLQANAHLISAAPEVYEALVDLFHEADSGCECGKCTACKTDAKVRAALAKARGES